MTGEPASVDEDRKTHHCVDLVLRLRQLHPPHHSPLLLVANGSQIHVSGVLLFEMVEVAPLCADNCQAVEGTPFPSQLVRMTYSS